MPRYETRIWEADPNAYGGRSARRSVRLKAFIPDTIAAFEPLLSSPTMARISEAERAIQSLNQPLLAQPLGGLASRLLRAESVASSRIEGLQISQRRLARAEAEAAGSRDATARAVLGNVVAMDRIIELAGSDQGLRLADLLAVHRLLMEQVPDTFGAGTLRDRQNWLGGTGATPADADYVPPPPEHVPALVRDLLAFVARGDVAPVLQAAIAHAQFEAIHPFADGNGRVGRALIHYVLRRSGLASGFVPPISVVLAANKERYVAGLEAYTAGKLPTWIETFAWAIGRASRASQRFLEDVSRLREEWRTRAGHPRSDSSAEALIMALPGQPVVTVEMAARLIGRSVQAANTALTTLKAAGVVKGISAGKWRRAFEAPELLTLVNAFEHDLAVPEGSLKPARASPTRGRRPTR